MKQTIRIFLCGTMAFALGNQTISSQVLISLPDLYQPGVHVSPTYKFRVLLTDSSVHVLSACLRTGPELSFLIVGDNKLVIGDSLNPGKLFPSQVISISRMETDAGFDFVGIRKDSEWLFKVRNGKLSSYSFFADDHLSFKYISFIQKDDGPIVKLNQINLQEMIVADNKALSYCHKGKFEKAIKVYNKHARE